MAGLFRRLCVSLVAVFCGSALPAMASPAIAAEAGPVRIMLYGDSVTQGCSGDWTWRYRLWQDLTASGQSFDLVGPKNDVMKYTTIEQNSHAYRDPAFDTDHAAVGGMTFTYAFAPLPELAAQQQADVVVALIGVNDLTRHLATPAELIDRWRTEIARARALVPGISIVLGQLGQTWFPGVIEYDDGLVALAAELDTPDARVVATGRPDMAMSTDTYDSLHPSAVGERKIADVVAQALAGIGVGAGPSAAREAPAAQGDWAPAPVAWSWNQWIFLAWSEVDYASSENISVVDTTTGVSGELTSIPGQFMFLPGAPGHTYEIRLRPVKGYLPMGTESTPVTVTVPTVGMSAA
jgi:lysophospholipase L1-like esterase